MIVFHPVIETLGDTPFVPGSPGGEMKCPTCSENTPDAWQHWWVQTGSGHTHALTEPGLTVQGKNGEGIQLPDTVVQIDWMRCANASCGQLVVRAHASKRFRGQPLPEDLTQTWFVYPRRSARPIDPLVPQELKAEYLEAAELLEISPKMSAVLSRKLVFDLLERYAGIAEYTLKGGLDKFIEDTAHPIRVRENLQHLREIGDFGAHTKKDGVGQIIDVSREDAEWTLDLLDRLFDYFVIEPERDKKLRAAWDKNLQEAGRKPIPPAPEGDG